jgi:hypothetical protein
LLEKIIEEKIGLSPLKIILQEIVATYLDYRPKVMVYNNKKTKKYFFYS